MADRDSVKLIVVAVDLHTAHVERHTAEEYRQVDLLIELAEKYRGQLFERDG